ncbi:uncharacterized protein TNCV_3992851 [Trichonephila clavipes]|uniref:RNase H type-1 domain-containing protein n=1 Tax=Trichonephila clavipes TaxID=2585209 RepID=A0A8X6SZW9_TRICX|nr:uncharacterized protein TNCV_3992851 [Trichonephila clavipes]
MSVPSHPLKPFALVIGLNRLYEARSFNIKPFSERAKAVLNDAHLNNINIQENNILAFPPWDIQIFNYHNPFSGCHKADTADVIYQQLFSFHRKRRHPTVIEILILLRKLERKGFHIFFSWVPGHVGILGNEQADTAARSMSDHMQRPVCFQDLKTFTHNYIHRVWQETWDQQILNKLHNIHPSTSHWAALPVRRHDVRLTRLRIGHTRFTHRHLLLGRALDWFEVLGYRVVEDKVTDYAHLKQALSKQFPVVRNMSELETRFYSSSQKHNQKPSDFVYDLLKIHKILILEIMEEKLIDHIISRLEPQILDYVEVRNPQTTSNLLQIIDKYKERFLNRKIRGSSWESRDIKPNENNIFPNRYRQENWRETRDNNRYTDNSRPRREFNTFESQGVADNQRFDGRR